MGTVNSTWELHSEQRVHSSVVRDADSKLAGPWFNCGCGLLSNDLCLLSPPFSFPDTCALEKKENEYDNVDGY